MLPSDSTLFGFDRLSSLSCNIRHQSLKLIRLVPHLQPSLGIMFRNCPVQSSPVQSSPVQSSPVQSSPVQSSTVQHRTVRRMGSWTSSPHEDYKDQMDQILYDSEDAAAKYHPRGCYCVELSLPVS